MDDQDQNQQKKMKSIGTILSIYCYVVGGAFIFLAKPYKLLSVACMVGCALCLVIYEISWVFYDNRSEERCGKEGPKTQNYHWYSVRHRAVCVGVQDNERLFL